MNLEVNDISLITFCAEYHIIEDKTNTNAIIMTIAKRRLWTVGFTSSKYIECVARGYIVNDEVLDAMLALIRMSKEKEIGI